MRTSLSLSLLYVSLLTAHTYVKTPPLQHDPYHHPIQAAKPTPSWNESSGIINLGAAAPNFFSVLFQQLLNKSYGFLLTFILFGLLLITLLFWVPFIVVVYVDPDAIENCGTVTDALAFAFASLFSVDTHYRAASTASVFVVTAEAVVGKLAITALTALLVLKISKTPDNCIQSRRILVHKLKGKWTLSVRVAILYDQRIWSPKMTLSCIANTVNGWMPSTLEWSNHCLGHGFGRLDKLPLNLRHVVDDNSPLRSVNFEDEAEVRKNINCFILVIQGFDQVTGRSMGHEQRYDWEDTRGDGRGLICYLPRGKMCDVLVNSKLLKDYYKGTFTEKGGAQIGGVDWRMFNMIKSPKTAGVAAGRVEPAASSRQDGGDIETGDATRGKASAYAVHKEKET